MPENLNVILIEQLEERFSEPKVYKQLILQLQKDINRAGIGCEINKNLSFNELFVIIEELVLEKLNNAFNEYLNLLYAVDVSERAIRNCNQIKVLLLPSMPHI